MVLPLLRVVAGTLFLAATVIAQRLTVADSVVWGSHTFVVTTAKPSTTCGVYSFTVALTNKPLFSVDHLGGVSLLYIQSQNQDPTNKFHYIIADWYNNVSWRGIRQETFTFPVCDISTHSVSTRVSSTATDSTTTGSTATDSTATDSTATGSTATDSTATDFTATDSTATDSTAADSTTTDSTATSSAGTDSTATSSTATSSTATSSTVTTSTATDSTAPIGSSTNGSPPAKTYSSETSQPAHSSSISTGVIAAIAVAGFLALVLLMVAWLYYRRWKRERARKAAFTVDLGAEDMDGGRIEPFISAAQVPGSAAATMTAGYRGLGGAVDNAPRLGAQRSSAKPPLHFGSEASGAGSWATGYQGLGGAEDNGPRLGAQGSSAKPPLHFESEASGAGSWTTGSQSAAQGVTGYGSRELGFDASSSRDTKIADGPSNQVEDHPVETHPAQPAVQVRDTDQGPLRPPLPPAYDPTWS